MNSLLRPTEMAHDILARAVSPGDLVIDATVGNGHDTQFLIELVGANGQVVGFDIQNRALVNTRERTRSSRTLTLHLRSHEEMREVVESEAKGIMFNLGYLPSGDKAITTTAASTIPALDAAVSLLAKGGVLTVVVYPGHDSGAIEGLSVKDWAAKLDAHRFCVINYSTVNRPGSPPQLIAVERVR